MDEDEHRRIMDSLRPYMGAPAPREVRRAKLLTDARLRRRRPEFDADSLWRVDDMIHPERPGFIRSDAFEPEEVALAQAPGSNGYVWQVDDDGTGWIKRLLDR